MALTACVKATLNGILRRAAAAVPPPTPGTKADAGPLQGRPSLKGGLKKASLPFSPTEGFLTAYGRGSLRRALPLPAPTSSLHPHLDGSLRSHDPAAASGCGGHSGGEGGADAVAQIPVSAAARARRLAVVTSFHPEARSMVGPGRRPTLPEAAGAVSPEVFILHFHFVAT